MKLNTPDFQLKLLSGDKVDRGEARGGMTRVLHIRAARKQIKVRYDVTSVKREGNEAQVLVEQMDKRVQIRKDGKQHTVKRTSSTATRGCRLRRAGSAGSRKR
jgi:hypothetical protein